MNDVKQHKDTDKVVHSTPATECRRVPGNGHFTRNTLGEARVAVTSHPAPIMADLEFVDARSQESAAEEFRLSPVLKSHRRRVNKMRITHSHKPTCSHNTTVVVVDHQLSGGSTLPESAHPSTLDNTVLKVVDSPVLDSRHMLSPRPQTSNSEASNTRSPFINHDDSFLVNLDFEQIDSLCLSMESTPKRKLSKNESKKTPLSDRSVNSCQYDVHTTPHRTRATTPHRTRATNKDVGGKRKDAEERNKGREKTGVEVHQLPCVKNISKRFCQNPKCDVSVVAESSSGGEREQQQLPGRSSPDIFDDELLTDSFSVKISDSFDEELCQMEEGYYSKCDKNIVKLGEGSGVKSQDSELSFASTLDSQPLIGRFNNRIQQLTPTQPPGGVMSERERREAAVAAALEEAAKTRTSQEGFQLGPYFGLPSKVAQVIREHRGISDLYDWQEECINEGSKSRNLLICIPTSGGKTLVAEILMLRCLLLMKRDVIFILPYVALVQEKVRGLSPFGVELGFLVEEYAGSRGSFPPKTRRKKNVVYVATIEKASGLVNSLLELARVEELGLVVVDEVHMLAETGGRGASLEDVLTKLRYGASRVQLVAMSATVGNLKELAIYLDARLYAGNFRPVQLTECVKVLDKIWEVNLGAHTEEELLQNERLCCFPYSNEQKKIDVDMVGGLVGEVIPDHSCLVFCPTRRNCETLAELICKVLPTQLKQVKNREKVSLYRALVEEGGGSVCPVLRKTLPYGVAYHHSGLLEGEKRLLEEGYLMGTLCCLCCTSTLAAGINLPARRVIIRSPYTGKDLLTKSRYKQMVGRAGRAGLDTSGESILILQHQDLIQFGSLFLSPVESCNSTLADDENRGLTSLLFSSVGLGIAVSLPQLKCVAASSLLALQASTLGVDIDTKVTEIVECLRRQGLMCIKPESDNHNSASSIKLKNEGKSHQQCCVECTATTCSLEELLSNDHVLTVSTLGKAAIKGNIDLKLAGRLYKDLCVARENLALNSHLHLLYLVTPYAVVSSVKIIPSIFSTAYLSLGEEEVKVAKLLGITEAIVVKLTLGHYSKKIGEDVLRRFYVALLLHHLWSGMGIWQASELFSVHRGLIQQTLTSAAAFASCIYHFCQELKELWAFRDLLANFTHQLSACCSAELLPLLDLPAVKNGRARMLYNAGYHSLRDIASAKPKDLLSSVAHLPHRTAVQIIDSAKMLLIERAETLQGEAEQMLLGLN